MRRQRTTEAAQAEFLRFAGGMSGGIATTAAPARKPKRPQDEASSEDRGCVFWPRCSTCVYRVCVQELAPSRRAELAQAWRTLRDHIDVETIGIR